MKRILVIGDVMVDEYVEGRVERISPEAPVPIFLEDGRSYFPGGAANVAANIVAAGCSCLLTAIAGAGDSAEWLRRDLEGRGVEAALLAALDRPTTRKTRFIASGQQIMRCDAESAVPCSGRIEAQLIEIALFGLCHAAALVISDYGKGTLTPRVLREVIAAARGRGVPVIVDPKAKDFSVYARATVLKPNVAELEAATGLPARSDDEVVAACNRVMEFLDVKHVLATRGGLGMTLVSREGPHPVHLPAAARSVYDVVGAGDTALAYLAASLACGQDILAAMRFANHAAGIAVARHGTVAVTLKEFEDALL